MTDSRPQAHIPHPSEGVTRREWLRRTGAATAGAATVGGTASLHPTISPVGDADAHPIVLVAGVVGVLHASSMLLGEDVDEEAVDDYDTLQRLALWADATSRAAQNEVEMETTRQFVQDFAEFSKSDLYAEGALKALDAVEDDGADQQTALNVAAEFVEEEAAARQESIAMEAHSQIAEVVRIIEDAEVITDLDPVDLLCEASATLDDDGHRVFEDPEEWNAFESIEPDTDATVEYEFADGSTRQFDTVDLGYVDLSGGSWSSPNYLALEHSDTASGGVGVEEFPQDEYDNLDEEDQDAIDVPDDPIRVPLYNQRGWSDTWDEVEMTMTEVIDNIDAWLDQIYDDLVDGDLDREDVLTPSMMQSIASDQQTFPYAGASLEALGLPHSAQTVTLAFPEREEENEDGEMVTPESTGNLYAHPMPSSGFSKGSEYDPTALESTFYYSFHVVDEETGEQASEITELTEPFEIVEVLEIVEDEDGNRVVEETDELSFSERGSHEPPDNYDELMDLFDSMADLEREIAEQEHEIVVDLAGDGGGGGGGIWPDDWDGMAAPAGGLIALLVILYGIVKAAADAHPAT